MGLKKCQVPQHLTPVNVPHRTGSSARSLGHEPIKPNPTGLLQEAVRIARPESAASCAFSADDSRNLAAIENPGSFPLVTLSGLQIANGFTRVVFGGRGAYVEFTSDQLVQNAVHLPSDQLWRRSRNWRSKVFYEEYRSHCPTNAKLYFQRKTVTYADYQVGFFYVAPTDLDVGKG